MSLVRSQWIKHLGIYALYLGAALFLTWPLAAQLSTHLAGFEYGDSREMARHIWWYSHALRTGQPVFFQPLMGYPNGIEGGVLLWANPQQFFPAWLLALVLPLPAAANLAVLFYMALNGWVAYFLARHLLSRESPALLAGLVYLAAPTFQTHLAGGHAGLMVAWAAPLYVWALLRLVVPLSTNAPFSPGGRRAGDEGGQIRWFALAVLFFVLIPGGHILQTIYVTLPITAVLALWRLWARDWRGLAWIMAVNIVGALLLGLYLLPIAASIFGTSAYVDEGGFVRYSMDALSIVSPSFDHPLWGGLNYPRRVLGINLEEGTGYIGLAAGLLALIGALRVRAARVWLALALLAGLLALGPVLKVFDQPLLLTTDGYETPLALPYALLQGLPGFSLARTPGRFNFALALALALLAGYGVGTFTRSRVGAQHAAPLQKLAVLILALLILLDYRFFWPFPTFPADVPPAIHALAGREDIRAVFDIPWENVVAAKQALYLQTAHQQALIAGHVTRSTPVDPAKLTLLQASLDPVLLDAAGADVVIVHKRYVAETLLEQVREQLGTPLHEDADYAIFEPPAPAVSADPPRWTASDGVDYFRTVTAGSVDETPLTFANRHALYVYAPVDGWALLRARLSGSGRTVDLTLDGQSLGRWPLDDALALEVPLRLRQGYHSITLLADPVCPQIVPDGLRCQAISADSLTLSPVEAVTNAPVSFANGITLDYVMPSTGRESNFIWLSWQFEQPPTENAIRFIKILDGTGTPVYEIDSPIDSGGAAQWAEQISVELPTGDYHAYAGWYSYPDITRYAVLSDTEGAADGWAYLGLFRILE